MTLFEQFKNINKEYYINDSNFSKDFSLSKNQIIRFFEMGEKKSIIESFDNMDEMRANHSMSLLYLGVLLNDKLNLNMSMKVSNQTFDFNYFWSIICFYHDLGYSAENNYSFMFKINQKNSRRPYKFFYSNFLFLNKICNDFTLRYKYSQFFSNSISYIAKIKPPLGISRYRMLEEQRLLDDIDFQRIDKIRNIKVNYRDTCTEVKKSYFSEKEVINYYIYRLSEYGVLDHGIVGGYIFFDSIMKFYLESYSKRDQGTIIDFEKDWRYFCVEQIPLFAYIADCIVSHNIFFPTKDKKEIYKEYSILSIDKKRKISIRNNPILFLLDLIDTIDPVKYFESKYKYNTLDILKSFDCNFDKDTIILSLSKYASVSMQSYKEYTKTIQTMKEWLDIEVSIQEDKLFITINDLNHN